MPQSPNVPVLARLMLALLAAAVPVRALAREPTGVAGLWDVSRDQDQRHCRITLKPDQLDKGDHFVVISTACRRLMPILMKVGRWASDGAHLALNEPGGATTIDLAADGDAFSATGPDGARYRLTSVSAVGRSVIGGDPAEDLVGSAPVKPVTPVATRATHKDVERPGDLAGRYAILREKSHDTGCMLTLDDKTRVKGGDRAALAPACRDQGIVVFDPSSWQIVNGRLVLTAKAGHVTHLDKQEDGTWVKDPAEGKSLTLKKL